MGAATSKQGTMGKKVSKKKRDAARRAAEQGADNQNGRPNSTATAQGKQEAAWEEAEQTPQYDETMELAEYAAHYFARAELQAISDELRAQGNDKYTSIHDGLAPTIFASRLQTSIDLYTKAVEIASTPEQMASASKNLGFAHRKYAYKEGKFDVRTRHLCISVRHLCNAYVFGAACKPAA